MLFCNGYIMFQCALRHTVGVYMCVGVILATWEVIPRLTTLKKKNCSKEDSYKDLDLRQAIADGGSNIKSDADDAHGRLKGRDPHAGKGIDDSPR